MNALDRTLKYLACVIYTTLVTVTAAAVCSRYAANHSLVWAEELGRYLFIWIICIGATMGVAGAVHVSVDLVTAKASPVWQRRLALLSDAGTLVFLGVVVVCGTQLTLFGRNSFSLAMGLPMAAVYIALPASAAVMAIYVIWRIVRQFSPPAPP